MISVIIGHSPRIPDWMARFCFSFHMPFFFIISGYFTTREALSLYFVKKQCRALLVPYLWTSLILITMIAIRALLTPEPLLETVGTWTIACLYGSGCVVDAMPSGVIAVGATWFLLALFWGKIFLAAANESGHPFAWVLALFVVGLKTGDHVWLPFSVQPGMCACLFLYIGQQIKYGDYVSIIDGHHCLNLPFPFWACLAFCWLYCILFAGHLYMVSNTYESGLLDIVGGLSGSLCLLKLCELLCGRFSVMKRPLCILGQNTLPVLCMHLVELNVFASLLWGNLASYVWIIPLLVQLFLICLLVALLYVSPRVVSGAFFKSRRLKN